MRRAVTAVGLAVVLCLLGGQAAAQPRESAMVRAPELEGGTTWFNVSRPLTLAELRGRVVLLDFWTYCCVNCLHVIPDLERLEQKWGDALVVIGVHSAKFDTEKGDEAIRQAILRYGVTHPVVNDASFRIWKAYTNRAWPGFTLIDPSGRVALQTSGEGHLAQLDAAIGALVEQARAAGALQPAPLPLRPERSSSDDALRFPGEVLADARGGRLFVSDTGHHRILVVGLDGKVRDTIGGGEGFADGSYADARLREPYGLALDGEALYVADRGNHAIRKVNLGARTVETLAGTGAMAASMRASGEARGTALRSPWDLALVGRTLYVAMAGAHQIWALHLETGRIEPFAGSGREDIADGPRATAAFAQPSGLVVAGDTLYVADAEVSAVRAVDLGDGPSGDGGRVRTLVGDGLFEFGDRDGEARRARLQHPLGIAIHAGRLLVADTYNHKIKEIDLEASTVRTLVGTGRPGAADGPSAAFSEPSGLSIEGDTLYVADTNNHRIRKVNLLSGAVTTLQVQEPAAAIVAPRPEEVGAAVVQLRPVTLRAGSTARVRIDLRLPDGVKVNDSAPLRLDVRGEGDAVRVLPRPSGDRELSASLEVGASGAEGALDVSLSLYVCRERDATICALRAFRWQVPVRSAKDGAPVAAIEAAVTPL